MIKRFLISGRLHQIHNLRRLCCLTGSRDSVCCSPHELREIIHGPLPLENNLRQCLFLRMSDAHSDVLYAELLGDFFRFTGEL